MEIGNTQRKGVRTVLTRLILLFCLCLVCVPAISQQVWIDLGTLPGHTYSGAFGINSVGQVVGISSATADYQGGTAFLWTPPSIHPVMRPMTSLGTLPNFSYSRAYGINGVGQVAGFCSNATDWSTGEAFLWTPAIAHGTNGTITDLGVLQGYTNSYARAINNYGQVAGVCDNGPGTTSTVFLWTPDSPNAMTGTMIDLGTLPGNLSSYVYGLNNDGQIVGVSSSTAHWPGSADYISDGTAFLWTPVTANAATGSLLGLTNPLNDPYTYAFAINDDGKVAMQGFYDSSASDFDSFLWTPDAANGMTGSAISTWAYDTPVNGINNLDWILCGNAIATPTGAWALLNQLSPAAIAGWNSTAANAFNDRGQVAGAGNSPASPAPGPTHALLMTPAPLLLATSAAPDTPAVDTAGGSGYITLLSPAPSGGVTLNLATNSKYAMVPHAIAIPEGQTAAQFPIATAHIPAPVTVKIIAAYPHAAPVTGVIRGYNIATFTILPLIKSVTFAPNTITGSQATTGTVLLNAPAPSGGVVIALLSSTKKVVVPADITVPEGAVSATFPVTGSSVANSTNVKIMASYAVQHLISALTLLPP